MKKVAGMLLAKKNIKTMSTYAIFAFVVTGLYITYMAVVILVDLYGSKGPKKESVEVFDNADIVEDDGEEQCTVVDETDGGYAVRHPGDVVDDDVSESLEEGRESFSGENMSDEDDQDYQPSGVTLSDDDILEGESEGMQEMYGTLRSIQEQMTVVEPEYQESYLSKDFAFVMSQPINRSSRILKKIVNV